jgi:hypothetical protein
MGKRTGWEMNGSRKREAGFSGERALASSPHKDTRLKAWETFAWYNGEGRPRAVEALAVHIRTCKVCCFMIFSASNFDRILWERH